MVTNNDLNKAAYYERMDLIAAWIQHHRLPISLRRAVRRYFKSYLADKSAVNEADIWHDLSPDLQKDVGEYIIHDDVKNNPLFDKMSMSSVVRMQSILQTVTVLPGHSIATRGEAGTAMYVIVSGSLEMDRGPEQEQFGYRWTEKSKETHLPQAAKAEADEEQEEGHIEILGPGESFGEEVLLGFIENYHYTVKAVEKSKLYMIVEEEFNNLFQA